MVATALQATTLLLPTLRESPTNPRKHFDQKKLEELAENIKVVGITHPILARPLGDGAFEILCGHRRVRAAKLAGLEQVPANVREMGDQEALEVQLLELAQREDVHPLEEADGYRALHEDHGLSEEEIAAKVGRPASHVRIRLKLCGLVPAARKAYLAGKLLHGVAAKLALVPEKLQAEALKQLTRYEEPASLSEAARIIQREFMLDLGTAPFPVADATLTKAGACGPCPKRSGNQADLFGDVKKDTCTDPICFGAKREAQYERKRLEAKAAGRPVLHGKSLEGVFLDYGQVQVAPGAGYVDLDEACPEDPKQRPWRQVLGKELEPRQVTLAQDPRGAARELYPLSYAKKVAKAVLPKPEKQASEADAAWKKEEAKRKEKQALEEAVTGLALGRISSKVVELYGAKGDCPHPHFPAEFWRLLLRGLVGRSGYEARVVAERRGIQSGTSDVDVALVREGGLLSTSHVAALVLELAVAASGIHDPEAVALFKDACKAYGVDLHALEAQAKAELKAKKPDKAKPAQEVNEPCPVPSCGKESTDGFLCKAHGEAARALGLDPGDPLEDEDLERVGGAAEDPLTAGAKPAKGKRKAAGKGEA